MNVEEIESENVELLMSLHLAEKRLLKKLNEMLEYEETKGLFRGWKFHYLQDLRERTDKMVSYLENMISLCYPNKSIYAYGSGK